MSDPPLSQVLRDDYARIEALLSKQQHALDWEYMRTFITYLAEMGDAGPVARSLLTDGKVMDETGFKRLYAKHADHRGVCCTFRGRPIVALWDWEEHKTTETVSVEEFNKESALLHRLKDATQALCDYIHVTDPKDYTGEFITLYRRASDICAEVMQQHYIPR